MQCNESGSDKEPALEPQMKRPERRQPQDAPETASGAVPSREQIQRDFDEEFAVPGEADSLMLDPNELHAAAGDPRQFLDYSRIGAEPDRSDHPPAQWIWVWRPLHIWLPALVLGVAMFVGSFKVAEILTALGLSMMDADGNDWSGALRLLLTLIGLIVIAIAAADHRPLDWTDETQAQLERDREYFHRKKFGGK